jgi:hypothetical protein
MSRLFLALALAAMAAAPAASFADGPATRTVPRSFQSPTDEYVPPAHPSPRAQRMLRRAPAVRHGSLTAYIRTLPSYLPPPSLGSLSPASGPAYSPAPSASTYYYYPYPSAAPSYAPEIADPPVPPGVFTRQDFDGAPCPTRSRTSLGELFACTR